MNRTSIVNIAQIVPIARTFLQENERKKILDKILELEKIKENENFLMDNFGDNLIGHKRTNWELHKEKAFKEEYDILHRILFDSTLQMSSYPSSYEGGAEGHYTLSMRDMWFARNIDGFTRPHTHGNIFGVFSFSCYLHLPNKETNLTFMRSDQMGLNTITAREGDILIFPSNMLHFSYGLEKERSLISGNYNFSQIHIEQEENNQNYQFGRNEDVYEMGGMKILK